MKEENTLTAKEWLEKEELYSCTKEYRNKVELAVEEVDLFIYMEKYANYKNRILEEKILQFRQTVKNTIQPIQVEEYDEHFDIQVAREGKIE